ncbi:shikimate kinase [Ktedonosporobacter rubrisoli]|uniref:shikimate kinase n=1 Tax=Ktedonosporobacter rubrisoli TaxID=2509675 RepID=UPI001F5D288D|nr:shikimate kinase [Ktedonosporobacter rubrisoli]
MILFGLSGSGKSTVGTLLKKRYEFPVLEADDDVELRYNGVWPAEEHLIDASFEETNLRVLEMQHVFYITSWLEKDRIREFSARGFQIILLVASLEELLRRRQARDGAYPPALVQRAKKNYRIFRDTIQEPMISPLFALTLDMLKTSPEQAVQRILDLLQSPE